MHHYLPVLLIAGLASLGMAFMPAVAKRTGISYALIYVAIGMLTYLLAEGWLPPYLYPTTK